MVKKSIAFGVFIMAFYIKGGYLMHDVAIIGSGIVGAAIARELSKYSLDVLVIDKDSDIANGTTKANSGIVHAGYDAREGTLKAKLNVVGNAMYSDICNELEVPFRENGSLVIGFNDKDIKNIETLYERGIKNGVKGLEIIDKNRLLSMEQNISDKAIGALYAPSGGIVSPYELAIALGENAAQNGVRFSFSTMVSNIHRNNEGFVIETNKKEIRSRFLVNASGLFADDINRMLGRNDFRIIPRRGEYCLLDKSQGGLVKRTIFQPPTNKGKGILVTPTVHGNLLIGPNAVEIPEREDASTTAQGIDEVIKGASRGICGINTREIITSFSGVRATPERRDFIINIPIKGAINACGIESPGLTAAPAIALMVIELLSYEGLRLYKKKDFIKRRVNTKQFFDMNEEERAFAIKANPLYGRIICRCEHVTEGDIINAINRPLGARSVDGVKKRVRAGMGRCQGGFCMPRVVEILARELGVNKESILKSGEGSYILTGRTK